MSHASTIEFADQHTISLFEQDQLHMQLPHIITFAKEQYTDDAVHGVDHIIRTIEHARRIHQSEGGCWDLVEVILWLHDIGRKYETNEKRNHAVISAEMARIFLQTLPLSQHAIELILSGIRTHSFSIGEPAMFLEAQIVSDADKCDVLGAIGIFRICAYNAMNGIPAVMAHFKDKILTIERHMYLPTSKQIARTRSERSAQFLADLLNELS